MMQEDLKSLLEEGLEVVANNPNVLPDGLPDKIKVTVDVALKTGNPVLLSRSLVLVGELLMRNNIIWGRRLITAAQTVNRTGNKEAKQAKPRHLDPISAPAREAPKPAEPKRKWEITDRSDISVRSRDDL